METFPVAVIGVVVGGLTLAINEIITFLVLLSKENKDLKDNNAMVTAIEKALEPTNKKLDDLITSHTEVRGNLIAVVTELKTLEVIKVTPVLSK